LHSNHHHPTTRLQKRKGGKDRKKRKGKKEKDGKSPRNRYIVNFISLPPIGGVEERNEGSRKKKGGGARALLLLRPSLPFPSLPWLVKAKERGGEGRQTRKGGEEHSDRTAPPFSPTYRLSYKEGERGRNKKKKEGGGKGEGKD